MNSLKKTRFSEGYYKTFQNFSKIDKEIDEKIEGDTIIGDNFKEEDIEKIKKIYTENLKDSVYIYYYDYYDFVSIFSKNKRGFILSIKFNFSDKMNSFKIFELFNENLKNLKNLEEIFYDSRFSSDFDYSEVIKYLPKQIKKMTVPYNSPKYGYKKKYEEHPKLEIFLQLTEEAEEDEDFEEED